MKTIVGRTECDCGEEWDITCKEALAFETDECPNCGMDTYLSSGLYIAALNYLEAKCKTSPIRIGRWKVSYNPKPMSDRRHDFEAEHLKYDGENDLYFTAADMESIINEIKDRVEDEI